MPLSLSDEYSTEDVSPFSCNNSSLLFSSLSLSDSDNIFKRVFFLILYLCLIFLSYFFTLVVFVISWFSTLITYRFLISLVFLCFIWFVVFFSIYIYIFVKPFGLGFIFLIMLIEHLRCPTLTDCRWYKYINFFQEYRLEVITANLIGKKDSLEDYQNILLIRSDKN